MISKPQETPELTLRIIEYGSLDLDYEIQYGTLFVGNTKAGKTTTCHHLMHSLLEGGLNDQKSVVYKLRNAEKRFKDAFVGDIEAESQTRIPNLFDYQDQDGVTKYLVDCPGYLDSFGCYRVISNRFFHYQVFSKVKKARFIITFTFNDMANIAEGMKNTFKAFLKGFSNLEDIKESLCNATAVMITGVPRNLDLSDVVQRYKGTSQKNMGDIAPFYKYLKKSLIEKDRIFIFKAAELGKKCDVNNDILKQVNKKIKFWDRLDKSGKIDMRNIKISISQYIKEDEQQQFQAQQNKLGKYFKQKIKTNLGSFETVIQQLNQDNCQLKNQKNQDSFLKKITDFVAQRQNSQSTILEKYNIKIQKNKQAEFKPASIMDSESANISDMPFWLTRLKGQKKIQQHLSEIAEVALNQQDKQFLTQQSLKALKQSLNVLIAIGKAKTVGKQKEKQRDQALLAYAYEIFKTIQISNKIFNLVSISINSQAKESQILKKFQMGMYFILVQYPLELVDCFINSIDNDYKKVVLKNLNKYKFEEDFTFKGLKEASKFFTAVKLELQSYQDFDRKTIQQKNSINNFVDNMIIKLDSQGLIGGFNKINQNLGDIREMNETSKKILLKIKECNMKAINSEKMKVENNRIIQTIGECLQKNNKLELALKVFDSLYNGFKVIEILDTLQDRKRKDKDPANLLKFLIKYAGLAAKYCRKELAIKKVQQALNLAQQNANIEKIYESSNLFKEIVGDKYTETSQYLKFMSSDIKQVSLSDALSKQIMEEAQIRDGRLNQSPDNKKKEMEGIKKLK